MANYKKWSRAEKQFILDHFESFSDKYIAARMSALSGENITDNMIRQQRRAMKTVKKRGRPKKKQDS
jgi:hypothetical protein